MIILYHVHQLFNVILTFLEIQGIQLTQNIVDVRHDDDNLVNNLKRHDFSIRKIEIMFSNELNSIKVRKIL